MGNLVCRIELHKTDGIIVTVENDTDQIREALIHYLGIFPQDAEYHGIQLNKDGSLVSEDLEHASNNSIVVEAIPIG